MIDKSNRLLSVKEYYFSRKLREVSRLIKSGRPIINMGIGSPDIKPHESVINALKESLTFEKAHMYQSYQGIPELRNAMSDFYRNKYNLKLDPSKEILPLIGSKEGIMHISLAFLNKGDKVLIPNPGYPTYSSVTKLLEATPVYYNLYLRNNWQPDIKELNSIDLEGVKIMWLNYPHMPTGVQINSKILINLINWARKNKILLVNDNPYSFILNDNPNSIMSFSNSMDVLMELNSLSKSHNLSGWRIGMVVGNSENINAVLKIKSNIDSGMFYGIQKGAIKALKLPNKWFDDINEIYFKRRQLVFELCKLLNLSFDSKSVGMFVWAKLSGKLIKAEEYIDELLEKFDIFIAPGTIFGSQGEGYVRFSLCVKEEEIRIAINRLK